MAVVLMAAAIILRCIFCFAADPESVGQVPRGERPGSSVIPDIVFIIVTRSDVLPLSLSPERQAFCSALTKSLAAPGGIRMTDKSPCNSRIAADTPESTILKASATSPSMEAASAMTSFWIKSEIPDNENVENILSIASSKSPPDVSRRFAVAIPATGKESSPLSTN